jgi:D-aminoacyl-tRNA deacylase
VRVVVQRVQKAEVRVEGTVVGATGPGLLVLVGVGRASTEADAVWLAGKTQGLRIFGDDQGRMNRSVEDIGGGVLAISQFTLYGDVTKGRRPSFVKAADPPEAERLYRVYCDALRVPWGGGVFGAHMVIDAVADGPVTILLERESG